MKTLFRCFLLLILICLGVEDARATIYDWIGNASSGSKTDWNNAKNWQNPSLLFPIIPTVPPGPGDEVHIGLLSFNTPPTITSTNVTAACASITIGSLLPLSLGNLLPLTVDGKLQVSGAIIVTPSVLISYTTVIQGTGILNCTSVQVGTTAVLVSLLNFSTTLTLKSTLTQFNITGDVIVTTASILIGKVDGLFSLQGGVTTITGKILTQSVGILGLLPVAPKFSVDMPTGTNISPTLKLTNADPINPASLIGSIDFFNNTGGGGISTVNYSGLNDQVIHTNTTPSLDAGPPTYQNLILSGSGTKTILSNSLTVGNDFTTTAPAVLFNATSSNPTAVIGHDWTNSSNVAQGIGDITVKNSITNNTGGVLGLGSANLFVGGNYTNNSNNGYVQGAGTTIFNGTGAQVLNDFTPTGTRFKNVTFTGASGKTMKRNTGIDFSVIPLNTLSVISGATLNVESVNTNANSQTATSSALTMLSDSTGDASIGDMSALLPLGSITGNINVQRFVKGGLRRYMLLSSPVANVSATAFTYNLAPVKVNTLITGPNGSVNGFNNSPATGNSPSVFVYDENAPVTVNQNLILDNEYKPFATLYESLPLGNGFVFYFRGNQNTLNPFTPPFPAATSATLNFFGTVMKGATPDGLFTANIINFPTVTTPPYAYSSSGAGITTPPSLSYNNFNNNTALTKRGLNLVGNPYASTIDLQKVYSGNGNKYQYYYQLVRNANLGSNSSSSKFVVYDAVSSLPPPTGASRYALSGQGFFIKATAANSAIVFKESMKVAYKAYLTSVPLSPLPPVFNVKKPNSLTAKSAINSNANSTEKILAVAPTNDAPNPPQIPAIRLELAKDSNVFNSTDINFVKTANSAFSNTEDAQYFQASGQGDLLYSLTADSVACFVNYMPDMEKLKRVNLIVTFSNYGIYKITAPAKANIDERYVIYLKDKYTNDSLDVVHNQEYAFNITTVPASYAHDRFYLRIGIAPGHEYKLLGFSGSKVTTGIQLTWKTDNESDFTKFVIEKSTNSGKSFTAIDSLRSTGAGSYTFTDHSPSIGQITYRLVQNLVTGASQLSKNLVFDYKDNTNPLIFMVYPSTATQDIHISLGKVYNSPVKINVLNSTGSLMKSLTAINTDLIQQNVGNLLKGLYIVEAIDESTGKRIGSTKFFKQ